MRSSKNRSKIILATLVALLAWFISYSVFNGMNGQLTQQQKLIEVMQKNKAGEYDNNYAYAVATSNLKAGEIVSDDDVDFKQFEDSNALAFENRSDVVNKILLQDISSGGVFTSAHIAKISNDDISLKEGYRALTLPSEKFQGRSAKMIPGTFVDVYSSSADSNWVLENVRIVSADGAKVAGAAIGLDTATAITFEVSAESISDFISNASRENLVLVARSASDKKVYHKKISSRPLYSAGGGSALPNLPSSVPIGDFGGSNMSGLPAPIQPMAQGDSVELIEANVKSKVTFD